jgi:hypothetical protein
MEVGSIPDILKRVWCHPDHPFFSTTLKKLKGVDFLQVLLKRSPQRHPADARHTDTPVSYYPAPMVT